MINIIYKLTYICLKLINLAIKKAILHKKKPFIKSKCIKKGLQTKHKKPHA